MCSWIPQPHGLFIHGIWGCSFLTLLFLDFPFYFPLWRFQTLASSPSAQKEWVSTGVRGAISSSNCDLFLGEKPQKQETSSTPFPPSESQPPSGICLPRSYFSIFREMVLFMHLCFSFCFVFYAEYHCYLSEDLSHRCLVGHVRSWTPSHNLWTSYPGVWAHLPLQILLQVPVSTPWRSWKHSLFWIMCLVNLVLPGKLVGGFYLCSNSPFWTVISPASLTNDRRPHF